MSFWENDPVVSAPQGGPRAVFTAPDPEGQYDRARDARTDSRADSTESRQEAGSSWTTLSAAEAEAEGLPRGQVYQRNGLGQIKSVAKAPPGAMGERDPERVAQIDTALQNISRLRQMAGETIGVGRVSGQIASIPVIGGILGQNRADIEGALEMVEGDLIQQQIARLAAANGGNGVATMANSETEARRMAASIANLNPNQSVEEFLIGLDRAEAFYRRQREGLAGEEAAQDNREKDAKAVPTTVMRTGGDGDSFVTEDDMRFTAKLQQAFDRGATMEELDALAAQNGYAPVSGMPGSAEAFRLREQGVHTQWSPPQSGNRSLIERALSDVADSSVGAYFAGAANAMTGGTIDEIAGAVGGEGAADRAQFAKEYMRDNSPVASFAGEVTGATMAMIPTARAAQALGRSAVAGEMAYGAAYGAGENNDNRVAGAAVGAAGAKAGDWLGNKLLQRYGRKIPAEAAKETVAETAENLTPAAKFSRAQEYGVDLSVGDVRGMGAKAVERTLDVQPGSAGLMNAGRDRTREQLTSAVDEVGGTYGGAATWDSMGEAAQSGARKWIAKAKGEKGNPIDRGVVGRAYDAIPISPKAPASVDNTLGALEEINSQFSSNPKLRAMMQDTRASKLLDALGEDGAQIGWSDLKALRSAIGEDMSGFRIAAQDSRQSTLSRLYSALSEDMRATAMQSGDGALAKFERANKLNRAVEERIDGALTSILGRDGAQNPNAAALKLRGMMMSGKSTADLSKLADIRKSMPADEWGEVAGAMIRLLGQPSKSEGRDFSAETFVRSFKDMSDPAKNLLFGKGNTELRQNLDKFAEVVGDVAGSNATRNTSNTAMGIAGLIGFGAGGAPGLVAQAVGSYGAAKLWTNPKFVRWATGYEKMLQKAAGSTPAPAAMKAQLAHLDRIAKGSGPVGADIIIFRDFLANAASRSPERLAAEPTEGDRQ